MRRIERLQQHQHTWARAVALALLVVILGGLLAACGEDDANGNSGSDNPTPTPTVSPSPTSPASPTPEPIAHPTGPNDLILKVETTGGFVPPFYIVEEFPSFLLYGDGTLIVPGPQIEIYPPPALPSLQVTKLSEEGIQAILRAARDAGLLDGDKEYSLGGIADAPYTYFTTTAGGQTSIVSAYALGFDENPDPNLTEEDKAARKKLQDFAATLGDVSSWIPAEDIVSKDEPYTIERLQVVRVAASGDIRQPQEGIERQEKDWPLDTPLADFGTAWFLDGMQCGVVEGAELETLMTALADANELTLWNSGDEQWALLLRPVFPHEQGCEPRQ